MADDGVLRRRKRHVDYKRFTIGVYAPKDFGEKIRERADALDITISEFIIRAVNMYTPDSNADKSETIDKILDALEEAKEGIYWLEQLPD